LNPYEFDRNPSILVRIKAQNTFRRIEAKALLAEIPAGEFRVTVIQDILIISSWNYFENTLYLSTVRSSKFKNTIDFTD